MVYMTVGSANKSTRGVGLSERFPRLLGERLCLHFVNTVEAPHSAGPVDFLEQYSDLVRWSWHAGAIAGTEAEQLLANANRQPRQAALIFERARALRASMDRALRALAKGTAPDDTDLGHISHEYVVTLTKARLSPTRDGFCWAWSASSDDLDRPLWLVVGSMVELLTTSDLTRLKICPGAGDCGWLFYDTSKNASRRWCSMEGCGSRVKMRRHYARRREQ